MILTQNTGIIMGPVTKLLGFIFNAIYNFFNGMGVESIALSIVVFTVVIRLILFPFNLKQTKSSKIQQYLRPEFNKITKKYKGKKDQESMLAQQRETRELQEKYGIKMTQGCLTSLLQFPVFIGLYNVIQNIPAYVPKVRTLYEPIANEIMKTENGYKLLSDFVDSNKLPRLASKLIEFATSTDATSGKGLASLNSVIDVLYKCNDTLFDKLSDIFAANPAVGSLIAENQDKINQVHHFIFGINLSEAPGFKLTPALLIPIISALCQLLSMIVMPKAETGDPQQDAQMKSMQRTMYIMPIMSFAVTVSAPAGLGIYWATSAFISFITTVLMNVYYSHADMEKIVAVQQEKARVKLEKKKASGKKSFMDKLNDAMMGESPEEETKSNATLNKYSNMNLKRYDNSASEESTSTDDTASENESTTKNQPKKGSLADKANAVKRFNDSGVQ
ncbi:MAG: YidC/Oxa1 family membrane protein insertase [Eubacterium sp.]|nr:YidC/Oxa1 family membrane protein insertase [Eubacterium sp.]